ncbi:hypothetical protein ACOCJ5_16815 [Knoellia sp. CPCC 206450]|uniref:hypothetical protein n=1 Tax=Knoellia tibetensis TaxID=3404798 RepID=UPI003B4321B2
MLPHEIDPGSGVRMVGGEIPEWSDLTPDATPAAVERLVVGAAERLAPGARVLLAGMPSARLRDRLPDALDVSVLVRGLPDARALADGSGSSVGGTPSVEPARSGMAVIAGALDRLHAAGDTFDLVVALGGPEATLAPDSTTPGARSWLRVVRELAGAGGAVVASVANPAGLDRLVGVGRPDGDEAWASVGDQHEEPLALATFEAGWDVLAAYPSLEEPDLVVSAKDIATSTGAGQLAVRALAAHLDEREKVRDVWSTATTLLDTGLGLALAPAWVVVRGGAPEAPAPAVPAEAQLVESRLREAVASRSHNRTRAVVTAYAAWLAGLSDSTKPTDSTGAAHPEAPSETHPATSSADLRDVLVDGAGVHSLVDGAAPAVAGGDDLERALTDFAERVCADGTARLWVAPTPALVLADLLSMVGATSGTSSAPAASGAEAAAHPSEPINGLDAIDDADARPSPTSRQALLLRLRSAEESLGETRRQVTWLEGTLRARDRRIRTLERAISVESSAAYKVVHQLGRPVPALKRRARAYLDRRERS